MPVPTVEAGDETESCPEELDTPVPPEADGDNSQATGAPAITGTVQVGETLTADTSGIADEDGLSNAAFNYQWISNDGTSDTDITGATNADYTLADADEGKTVKVQVSFTDDANNQETLTSAATDAVAAATQPNNPCHRRTNHQRHGAGGRDVDGGHYRHRRRGWAERCDLQPPVGCK